MELTRKVRDARRLGEFQLKQSQTSFRCSRLLNSLLRSIAAKVTALVITSFDLHLHQGQGYRTSAGLAESSFMSFDYTVDYG